MAKERRTKIGGVFAPRLVEMLESLAISALSLAGDRVLRRVEIELAHHSGTDNGNLPVTYENFVHYGVDRKTVPAAIAECVALGFLVVERRGRAGNAEWREPSLYRLTFRQTARREPTHDWRRFTSDEEAAAAARAARQKWTERDRKKRLRQKQKSKGEFPQISGGEPLPESAKLSGGENPPTCQGGKNPSTLYITGRDHPSQGGAADSRIIPAKRSGTHHGAVATPATSGNGLPNGCAEPVTVKSHSSKKLSAARKRPARRRRPNGQARSPP